MRLKHFLCAVDEWLFYVDYVINMEIRSLSWPCKAPEFVYVGLAALSAAPFFMSIESLIISNSLTFAICSGYSCYLTIPKSNEGKISTLDCSF